MQNFYKICIYICKFIQKCAKRTFAIKTAYFKYTKVREAHFCCSSTHIRYKCASCTLLRHTYRVRVLATCGDQPISVST